MQRVHASEFKPVFQTRPTLYAMQNHPPRGFPFYGLPPALLAAMSLAAPSLEVGLYTGKPLA